MEKKGLTYDDGRRGFRYIGASSELPIPTPEVFDSFLTYLGDRRPRIQPIFVKVESYRFGNHQPRHSAYFDFSFEGKKISGSIKEGCNPSEWKSVSGGRPSPSDLDKRVLMEITEDLVPKSSNKLGELAFFVTRVPHGGSWFSKYQFNLPELEALANKINFGYSLLRNSPTDAIEK